MLVATEWKEYELLDAGQGEKLERWGKVILRRPDPQAIWAPTKSKAVWERADAVYDRSKTGGGIWRKKGRLPRRWEVGYKDLRFYVEPTGFKHTGLFPEQVVNWDWLREQVRGAPEPVRALNLFGYTGGATVALAAEGARVCHVDAAKRMVTLARENAALSGLDRAPIRYITDDVMKFIRREARRGQQYDAILMDPPTYGRGPTGELWKLEETLVELIHECVALLSDRARLFLINSYTSGFSPMVAANLLTSLLKTERGGTVTSGEIGLPISDSELILPCGCYGRWTAGR